MADLEFGVDIAFDVGQIRRVIETQLAPSLERLAAGASDIGRSYDAMGRKGREAMDDVGDAARSTIRDFNRLNQPIEELKDDLAAVAQRANATRETLEAVGANPQLFATAERELERLLRLQAEFNDDQERIARDPGALRAYQIRFDAIRTELSKDISNINELLRSTARERGSIAARENAILRDQIQERADIRRRARGVEVAEIQTESAQLVQARRAQANAAIQQSQRQARVRIELLRFTFRQAQTIERAIGRVFTTSAAIIQGSFARVERTIFRIGNVFRRSDRNLNDGLAPALRAREAALERGFRRQSQIVSSSLTRQQRLVQTFNQRLSTGVAGAATGRSGLGALFGGGLAFGGGFLLLDRLRAGFDEAVDLTEALNKTREIFGDASADIEAFTENSVEALFITQSVALEGAANFGIFGKAAGLAGEDLSDFSIELLQLATDLASFNNTSVDDAIVALSAALRGENEPIRRFGVLLNQAVLQERAFNEGLIEQVRVLTPAEKVLAAYAEIMAQTVDAQGDAARTADDFANSSRRAAAASVETFAAIAGALVPIATIITNASLPAFQNLTRFINDDVGPVLSAVRDGLIGASAALGGLLAARVAGEAVQFLAIALRAAATPLGFFITAVAGLGAAINILRSRVPEVQVAIDLIGNTIRDVLGAGISFAERTLGRFVDFVVDVALPALQSLAGVVGGILLTGLEATFNFIALEVLPVLRRFSGFVRDQIVPAVERLGDVVEATVVPALRRLRDVANSVFTTVAPLIAPAIQGFQDLAMVIMEAFQGNLSGAGLLAGLESLAEGIGRSFANVGSAIFNALRPQIARAVGFIEEAFSNINFTSVAGTLLDLVELVGRILGTIVSSPEFVTAVGAIAAAAVVVGARFVQGFIEGVISNLDDLGDLIGPVILRAFTGAISFAFRNPTLIAGIIVAGFAATQIRRAWVAAGEAGARSLATGFFTGLRTGIARDRAVVTALFGGPGVFQRAVADQAAGARTALLREFQGANRTLRRLGESLVPFPRGGVTQAAVDDANRRIAGVEEAFGRAGVSARIFRTTAGESLRAVGDIAAGTFGRIVRGSNDAAIRAQAGFQQLRISAGDAFARIRQSGAQLGVAAGNAALASFGAVLSGQQGFTTLGVGGIFASALTAGIATGSPIIAAAVAGVGLVSAAFAESGDAAREAAQRIEEYVDILERVNNVAEAIPDISERLAGLLVDQNIDFAEQLGDLGINIDRFAEQIADGAFTAADAIQLIGEALNFDRDDLAFLVENVGGIGNSLDVGRVVRRNLQDTGVTLSELIDLIALFEREGEAFTAARREIEAELGILDVPTDRFARSFFEDFPPPEETPLGEYGPFLDEIVNRNIQAPNPFQDLLDTFLPNVSFEVDAVGQSIESLNEIRIEQLRNEIDAASGQLGAAREAARLAREALTEYLTGDYTVGARNEIDDVINSVDSVGNAIANALELGGVRGESALNTAAAGFARSIAEAIQQGFESGLRTPEEFAALLDPIRTAIQEAIDSEDLSQGAGDELFRILEDALNAEALEAGIDFVTATEEEVDKIQAELDRLNAELNVTLTFDPATVLAQIQALGLETDLDPEQFQRQVQILQTPTATVSQQEADFLASAQRNARTAAVQATTDTGATVTETNNVTFNVTNNIQSTTPIATGSEVVTELAAAAAAGGYSPTRSRRPVRVNGSSRTPI